MTPEDEEVIDQLLGRVARLEGLQRGATHRCRECLSEWVQHANGTWSLVRGSQPGAYPMGSAGKCCDNVAMGEQIEALR